MPYNAEKPEPELVNRIKKRHPKATSQDVKDWIRVFNRVFEDNGAGEAAEEKAFSAAWGVLKRRFAEDVKAEIVCAGVQDHFKGGLADKHQLEAAATGGRVVVPAGAGSGKTATLVARVGYLINEQGVWPNRILVCTFGRDSTADVKEKLRKAIGRPAEGINVQTIHATCFRALKEHSNSEIANLIGSGSPVLTSINRIVGSILRGIQSCLGTTFRAKYVTPGKVVRRIDRFVARQLTPSDVTGPINVSRVTLLGDGFIERITEQDEETGESGRSLLVPKDFDRFCGLIWHMVEAFKRPEPGAKPWPWMPYAGTAKQWVDRLSQGRAFGGPGAQGRSGEWAVRQEPAGLMPRSSQFTFSDAQMAMSYYLKTDRPFKMSVQRGIDHIFVDEVQDTSPMQFDVIWSLADHVEKNDPNRTLWLVGDDAQSIYSFRGADPSNFVGLVNRDDMKVRKLVNNYRSTRAVVEMGNNIISHNQGQIQKRAVAAGSNAGLKNAHVGVYDAGTANDAPIFAVERIQAEMIRDKVPPEHFAVLARTNVELARAELACLKARLPYIRAGNSQSLFTIPEVAGMLAWFMLACPGNEDFWSTPALDKACLHAFQWPKRDQATGKQAAAAFSGSAWKRVKANDADGLIRQAGQTKKRFDSSVYDFTITVQQVRAAAASATTPDEVFSAITSLVKTREYDSTAGYGREAFIETPVLQHIHDIVVDRENMDEGDLSKDDEGNIILERGLFSVLHDLGYETGSVDEFVSTVREIKAAVEAQEKAIKNGQKPQAVVLSTLHRSKGLEFEHVFLIANPMKFPLWRTMRDAEDARDRLERERDTLSPQEIRNLEDLVREGDTERRLAYVGITRARQRISFVCPTIDSKGNYMAPSVFLGEARVGDYTTEDDLGMADFLYESPEALYRQLSDSGQTALAATVSQMIILINAGKFDEAADLAEDKSELWPLLENTPRLCQARPKVLSLMKPDADTILRLVPYMDDLFNGTGETAHLVGTVGPVLNRVEVEAGGWGAPAKAVASDADVRAWKAERPASAPERVYLSSGAQVDVVGGTDRDLRMVVALGQPVLTLNKADVDVIQRRFDAGAEVVGLTRELQATLGRISRPPYLDHDGLYVAHVSRYEKVFAVIAETVRLKGESGSMLPEGMPEPGSVDDRLVDAFVREAFPIARADVEAQIIARGIPAPQAGHFVELMPGTDAMTPSHALLEAMGYRNHDVQEPPIIGVRVEDPKRERVAFQKFVNCEAFRDAVPRSADVVDGVLTDSEMTFWEDPDEFNNSAFRAAIFFGWVKPIPMPPDTPRSALRHALWFAIAAEIVPELVRLDLMDAPDAPPRWAVSVIMGLDPKLGNRLAREAWENRDLIRSYNDPNASTEQFNAARAAYEAWEAMLTGQRHIEQAFNESGYQFVASEYGDELFEAFVDAWTATPEGTPLFDYANITAGLFDDLLPGSDSFEDAGGPAKEQVGLHHEGPRWTGAIVGEHGLAEVLRSCSIAGAVVLTRLRAYRVAPCSPETVASVLKQAIKSDKRAVAVLDPHKIAIEATREAIYNAGVSAFGLSYIHRPSDERRPLGGPAVNVTVGDVLYWIGRINVDHIFTALPKVERLDLDMTFTAPSTEPDQSFTERFTPRRHLTGAQGGAIHYERFGQRIDVWVETPANKAGVASDLVEELVALFDEHCKGYVLALHTEGRRALARAAMNEDLDMAYMEEEGSVYGLNRPVQRNVPQIAHAELPLTLPDGAVVFRKREPDAGPFMGWTEHYVVSGVTDKTGNHLARRGIKPGEGWNNWSPAQ